MASLLWVALFLVRRRSANVRYLASCAALGVMAISPVVTACLLFNAPQPAPLATRSGDRGPHRGGCLPSMGWPPDLHATAEGSAADASVLATVERLAERIGDWQCPAVAASWVLYLAATVAIVMAALRSGRVNDESFR